MRWSGQTIDAEDQARLPGYRDGAVVRHFDAPEALDIRFYEVDAKSALNRVPDASQVPFRWTVNPYRGCTHACTYCVAGDTPILMADGRTRRLDALRVGDAIVGTTNDGGRRRSVPTEVLAHWSTEKPALRVELHGGDALIASADHRFLGERSWLYVARAGRERDAIRVGDRLVRPGDAPPAVVTKVQPYRASMRLYDITTGTGDFVANGVVSHNCFARPTHKYLDFDAGRDFEREIVVKVNAPEVLRAELRRPSWKGEHVALGTNTDPYQWVEGRYKLMRGIWEAFLDACNPCSVLTKSPLVLRDLDLLRRIAAVAPISANFSVPTLDEKEWRASEPHSPHPRARLEAVGELNRAGIPTGILIAPLMPGINDRPEQVERILELAAEHGATGVSGIALHLRGDVRRVFMDWLRSYRPDLVGRYEELYGRGGYAPAAERQRLMGLVRGGEVPALPSEGRDHRGVRRPGWGMGHRDDPGEGVRPAPPVLQQSLF